MLTHLKKAAILIRTGTVVPPFPTRDSLHRHDDPAAEAAPSDDMDARLESAVAAWNRKIESMFVDYAAARAAKSLRDAEQASQLSSLRLANSRLRTASR